jgi:hypothetical protein
MKLQSIRALRVIALGIMLFSTSICNSQSLIEQTVIYDGRTDDGYQSETYEMDAHEDATGRIYLGIPGGIQVLTADYRYLRTIPLRGDRFNN